MGGGDLEIVRCPLQEACRRDSIMVSSENRRIMLKVSL